MPERSGHSTADVSLASTGFVGFSESVTELGEVPWASEQFVCLPFVNHSEESVTIESVRSTCGCTLFEDAGAYRDLTLEPDDELLIEVTMTMGKRPGVKRAAIELGTTDGNVFSSLIRAQVVGTWHLSADTVSFGKVFFDDPEDPLITVVFSSECDRLLAVPKSSVPWLACSTAASAAGESETAIEFRVLKAQLAPGMNSTLVIVTTTNSQVPSRRIAVTARGVPALVPYPPHLVLLPGMKGSIQFVDQSGDRVDLNSLEAPTEFLEARLDEKGRVELRAVAESVEQYQGTPLVIYVRDDLGRRGRALVSVIYGEQGEKP